MQRHQPGFARWQILWALGLVFAQSGQGSCPLGLGSATVPDWGYEPTAFTIIIAAGVERRASGVPDWEDDEIGSVRIEVVSSRAGDLDVFPILLTRPRALRLESRGEADTYGELLDDEGRSLAWDDDGGRGANFRIEANLPRGRYWLGVLRVKDAELHGLSEGCERWVE